MQSTNSQILTHLKRSGGSSVDELATALGLARMTVRQHLATMERDGLVLSREERRPTGRPHFMFSLSDRGQETFPKRYDRLADLILQAAASLDASEIAGLSEVEKKRLLFGKMVEQLGAEYAPKVSGKVLAERVAAVAEILQKEGGFAEWRLHDAGYEIIDYNCVYRRVVDTHDDLCDWHLSLLSRLLGREVQCSQFQSRGAESCRFVVREESASEGGPVARRDD